MGYIQHSFDHFGLHLAAMAGDDEGVRRALDMGADINSLDKAGRTAVMCAVAGNHWQNIDASFLTPNRLSTIQILLRHPRISLFTLNAPHSSMNGVIPLGMAAWLNLPDVVRLLLEDSAHTVSVDGMDSHGATALMYAARDSNLEVVQCLLLHGARPDFRDSNHRTSIQFALAHHQILWLCESILRRHRWRESQSADRNKLLFWADGLQELATSSLPSDCLVPPSLTVFTNKAISRLTDTLISSVASSDLSFLYSLLFAPALPHSSPAALYPMSAPVLVNRPDSRGWAPIHYSMEQPCIQILDALYCAGAEVSLFTTDEHYTPLHILAKSVNLPVGYSSLLEQFTVHLIRDLRAPLSARDKNDETCIHIAAEHGHCINILMILLDFDVSGCIRELRNFRGLTALEVCKPEFRIAFGDIPEELRCESSVSSSTIRATTSFSSLASFSEWKPAGLDDTVSLYSAMDFDVEEAIHQLLCNLRTTSPVISHGKDPEYLGHLTNLVCASSALSCRVANHFRSRVLEASKQLQELQDKTQNICALLDKLVQAASDRLRERGVDDPKPRDSAESENTAVASQPSRSRSSSIAKPTEVDDHHTSVATQTAPLSGGSTQVDGLILASPLTYQFQLASLVEIEREIVDHSAACDKEWNVTASLRPDAKLKQLVKKKRKVEDKIRELEAEMKGEKDAVSYGTSKFKAWIKRIISLDRPAKLEIVMDIDEDAAVGREVKGITDFSESPFEDIDLGIDGALHTSHVVLRAAQRDLLTILQCLNSAEQFINFANYSIARAERVVKRAVKKRETMIENLCYSASAGDSSDEEKYVRRHPGIGYSNLLSLQPSIASLSSVYSSHSIAPASMGNDDEDTRAVRRLLLRKIEAGVVGSWDEIDKATGWLRIVKEVVRGVKRRAYL